MLRAYDHRRVWIKGKLSPACREHLHAIDLHFHDRRHEAGSRWSEAGWPLAHVQANLGHANLTTTSIYINVDLQQRQESMRRYGTQPLHVVAQTPAIDPQPLGNEGPSTKTQTVVN